MSVKIMSRSEKTDSIEQCDYINELHPVLQKVYKSRGISHKKHLEKELVNILPYNTLKDIDKAVDCIIEKILNNQLIMIVGDFDVDGATSTALAVLVLKAFGAKKVDFVIPNRFDFGYGLTPKLVESIKKHNPSLLVTVDNGIASVDGVKAANDLGINVVVTDHHLPAEISPDAVAIVNPNQNGDVFPSKNLAGVGVTFYVLLALRAKLKEIGWFDKNKIKIPNMARYLDLVALGTVGDLVPLDHNNRTLVSYGLGLIRQNACREGIKALLRLGKRELKKVVASDLGFAVGPRLNAAGRLEDMALGVECLLADNIHTAQNVAQELDALNYERRQIEADMRLEAMEYLKQKYNDPTLAPVGLCLHNDNWHQGVIGIVSSRVKDLYHRPVFIFANDGDEYIKASGRSIKGLHLKELLDKINKLEPDLLIKYGGHAMAAGLSIRKDNFDKFEKLFIQVITDILKGNTDILSKIIETDGELGHADFNLDLARLMKYAEPWGQEFPEPVFHGKFKVVEQKIVAEKHLKLRLEPIFDILNNSDKANNQVSGKVVLNAIAFNIDREKWPNYNTNIANIVYKLDINVYSGLTSLQLLIDYIEAI
tara:strand:- start:25004 stop:26791 length:1788 start_codon:yes stop_codon:yes gene_type:complete